MNDFTPEEIKVLKEAAKFYNSWDTISGYLSCSLLILGIAMGAAAFIILLLNRGILWK
jgi:hypothetical protein